jgi:hypothetical protein
VPDVPFFYFVILKDKLNKMKAHCHSIERIIYLTFFREIFAVYATYIHVHCTIRECGIFRLFGLLIKDDARSTSEVKPGIATI